MTNDNNSILGDLEFKAEDFEYLDVFGIVNFQPLADEANRLLRERLRESKTAVGGFFNYLTIEGVEMEGFQFCNNIDSMEYVVPTHTARLVCIEEIKK